VIGRVRWFVGLFVHYGRCDFSRRKCLTVMKFGADVQYLHQISLLKVKVHFKVKNLPLAIVRPAMV